MGKTAEENSKKPFFTKVPDYWSSRKDVPLAMKVIVAYIYTRANIDTIDWNLVAANIVKLWGLPKSTVSKIMKELERQGVINHTEMRRIKKGEWHSKMFKIDRKALQKIMSPPSDTVHPGNRYGSPREPLRFIRRTATVHLANLEEEVKEENNKKRLEEEGKSEMSSSINYLSSSMPYKNTLAEQFADICGAVTKTKTQDLSASTASPCNNPTETPQRTDTQKEMNDYSARPADAARNNQPIPSARPVEVGEVPKTKVKRSALDEFLACSSTEQVEWLDAIEATKSMAKDLKAGKDVPMTKQFADYFANL